MTWPEVAFAVVVGLCALGGMWIGGYWAYRMRHPPDDHRRHDPGE